VPAPSTLPPFDSAVIDFGDGKLAQDKRGDCANAKTASDVYKRYQSSHTYAKAGTYTITFRVSSCNGPTETATTKVTV
jgi:hypothetical protein